MTNIMKLETIVLVLLLAIAMTMFGCSAWAADYRQIQPVAPTQFYPVQPIEVVAAPVPTLPLVLSPLFLPFLAIEALLMPVPLPVIPPPVYQPQQFYQPSPAYPGMPAY